MPPFCNLKPFEIEHQLLVALYQIAKFEAALDTDNIKNIENKEKCLL